MVGTLMEKNAILNVKGITNRKETTFYNVNAQ